MGYVVFGSGPSATHTGTGILEPTILTYFFVYVILCGSALTVATLAANALKVLDDISFEIPTGRAFCLLGRSGTGKSVALRHIDWGRIGALVLAPGVPLTHPAPHWTVGLARNAAVEVIGDIANAIWQIKEDIVPQGTWNCEKMLKARAAELKCDFPDQVHFLLANHDLAHFVWPTG